MLQRRSVKPICHVLGLELKSLLLKLHDRSNFILFYFFNILEKSLSLSVNVCTQKTDGTALLGPKA